MNRLRTLWTRLRNRLASQSGSASIEFVIVFPVFIGILITSIEGGILMTRGVMLERALDITVRDLRLGRLEPSTMAELRRRICAQTILVDDCQNDLMLELRPINTTTWAGLNDPETCIDREEDIAPSLEFTTGDENDLMIVRACVIVDPIIDISGFAMALPREPGGGFRLAYSSVFVNEPR